LQTTHVFSPQLLDFRHLSFRRHSCTDLQIYKEYGMSAPRLAMPECNVDLNILIKLAVESENGPFMLRCGYLY